MATEKRLIYANECYERAWDYTAFYHHVADMSILRDLLNDCPTVDAVPVDEIKLHHVIIDNEGVPEVKLQIGDRYFLLRTDPVDVREVVHGRWKYHHKQNIAVCTNCSFERDLDVNFGKAVSCPNCGADMRDGDGNG